MRRWIALRQLARAPASATAHIQHGHWLLLYIIQPFQHAAAHLTLQYCGGIVSIGRAIESHPHLAFVNQEIIHLKMPRSVAQKYPGEIKTAHVTRPVY